MIRLLMGIVSIAFLLFIIGCPGGDPTPRGVNINPPKKDTPPPKPDPVAAQMKFLESKCGACHDKEAMPGLLETMKGMDTEQFKAALQNPDNHTGLELSEEELNGLIDFFDKWKMKESEKATKKEEEKAEEPDE